MKLLEIIDFLPTTANSLEHSSVLRLKALIDDIAKSMSTTVSTFDVSNGIAVVGFADDKALEKLSAQFAEVKDVTVSEITLLSFQRELNRAAQDKVNKMRAKKAEKKA